MTITAALSYFPTIKYRLWISGPFISFLHYLFFGFLPWHSVPSVATTVVINCYRTPASPKFRQLYFSFRKMWGYPTSSISWFIKLRSRMSLECVVSIAQRQKLTANGFNKPKQKVLCIKQAILEAAIERGCGKRCS